MFKLEFQAHNSRDWRAVHPIETQRAAYELVCALNYTGFSYRVSSCGIDVTEAFERQLKADTNLPVTHVAGGIPPRMTTIAELAAIRD